MLLINLHDLGQVMDQNRIVTRLITAILHVYDERKHEARTERYREVGQMGAASWGCHIWRRPQLQQRWQQKGLVDAADAPWLRQMAVEARCHGHPFPAADTGATLVKQPFPAKLLSL